MSPQWRHGNPCGGRCSGSAAPPLPELNHTSVTKPPDWRTVIWTCDTGDETRGQTKLAHQRDEPTLQAISYSSLQWIGNPTWFWEGRPRLANGANRRTRWSSDVLGVSNDKESKGGSNLSFSRLEQHSSPLHRPLLWPLGLLVTGNFAFI